MSAKRAGGHTSRHVAGPLHPLLGPVDASMAQGALGVQQSPAHLAGVIESRFVGFLQDLFGPGFVTKHRQLGELEMGRTLKFPGTRQPNPADEGLGFVVVSQIDLEMSRGRERLFRHVFSTCLGGRRKAYPAGLAE